MTRKERTLRRAARLEAIGYRRALRASFFRNPLGWAAIRAGQLVARSFAQARQLLLALADREAAAAAERKKRKLPRDWYKVVKRG